MQCASYRPLYRVGFKFDVLDKQTRILLTVLFMSLVGFAQQRLLQDSEAEWHLRNCYNAVLKAIVA